MDKELDWVAILDALADVLAEVGGEGWLVGGCLRDALLSEPVRDVDVAITGEPLSVAEQLAQRSRLAVARLGHGTIRLSPRRTRRRSNICLDLTPLQGATIISDLALRDFTVNAMALPLNARAQWLALVSGSSDSMPNLVDPFHGREHLEMRRLIAVGSDTFRSDPGRIVRAARMRASFGLLPDTETLRLARAAVPQLKLLSPDRLRDELNLLLALPAATDGIALLNEFGALTTLFPGLTDDDTTHALASLRLLDRLIGVAGAAVEYPSLQAWSASGARRIALRRAVIAHASEAHDDAASAPTLVRRAQDTLETEDESERFYAVRLLFMRAGKDEAVAADALLVAAACEDAHRERAHGMALAARADALIGTYRRHRAALIPTPLLSGKDLMLTLGIPAGPLIGRMLRAVRLAQLADEAHDREAALALARRLTETNSAESPSE